jgi:hypothetical protein
VKEAVDGKKAQKEVAYGEYRGHTEWREITIR